MTADNGFGESGESLQAGSEWMAALAASDMAEEAPQEEKRGFSLLGGLLPWQRFVLALLLFLDVAVVGFLFLVMLGCMEIG